MDDDFKVLRDFADGQTDGRTNERTNRQTFVIVESLSRLKNMTHFKFKLGQLSVFDLFKLKFRAEIRMGLNKKI